MKEFICDYCETMFKEYPSNRRGKLKYCSKSCSNTRLLDHTPWNKGYGEYTKGDKNPFYGKKHNKKAKMVISKKGKGRTPWNKGKTGYTTKRKGYTVPEETRKKISKSLVGKFARENNPAWKGGTQTKDKIQRVKFRKTIQEQVLERDNYTCQMCGSRGIALQVDHIQSWAKYVELRFDINNCRTLCQKCHYEITFGKTMPENIKVWGHNLKHVIERGLN